MEAIRYEPEKKDLVITINKRLSPQAASGLQVRITEARGSGRATFILAVESGEERELRVRAPLELRAATAESVSVEVWHGGQGRLSNTPLLQVAYP